VGFPQGVTISSGTGFVVSRSGDILTNYHVIKECERIAVQAGNTPAGEADLSSRDDANDLALIRVKTAPASIAVFREGPPVRLGEHVIALGYPLFGVLASSAILSEGSVSALAGLFDDSRYYQISAPVQPGNSGGPLLDTSGHVLGIVSGKLDAMRVQNYTGDIPQNVNFAIKADTAKYFLDSRGIRYETARSEQQMSTADVADLASQFTVYIECRQTARVSGPAAPAPQVAAQSLIQTISNFSWAIGSQVNCGVPDKTYSLQITSGSIVWRSGIGDTDVEAINYNGENQAQTTTLKSNHKSGHGESPGTIWNYTRIGPDRVQVSPAHRSPFVLARCR
jgi:hypothetical protein